MIPKLGRRWLWLLLPVVLGLAVVLWRSTAKAEVGVWKQASAAQRAKQAVTGASMPMRPDGNGGQFAGDPRGLPEAMPDPNDLPAQRALWEKRLARSTEVLENYRRTTRYPFESRPASEHGDQMYPNQALIEEKRLYLPGDERPGRARLRTSQERIYVAGAETVLFTIGAIDDEGRALPVSILTATVGDPPQGNAPAKLRPTAVVFGDSGTDGDAAAGDGTWTFRFAPSTQGFANFTGQLRLETIISVDGQAGFTFFDMYYTPAPPAIWAGPIREIVEAGSLHLYLKVDVKRAGHYVATGRFDDAGGKPFALAVFNGALATGPQEILFRAYGKLIKDSQAALPLKLRDVDGFLLLEDASPDRALMPRLMGAVYTTRQYPLDVFSDAEWQSEERERYLREYLNDVALAKARLEELNRRIGLGGKPG